MRKRDPRPVMVIDEGKCQLIGEAKSNEFHGVQEPLPDAMRLLLCLIDGAERRHRLVRKWRTQAAQTFTSKWRVATSWLLCRERVTP